MAARPLRIAHLIDLAKVGGVETLYADFIQAPHPDGVPVAHFTVLDSPRMAARFVQPVQQFSQQVLSPRQWGGVTLPRRPHGLRAYNRLRLLRKLAPDVIVAWNQFTDFRRDPLPLPCPLVYYEHGMSWYTHSPRQLSGFLPHIAGAIAASEAAAQMLRLKHGVTAPIEVCLNPIRARVLSAHATPRQLDPAAPIRLGWAGRLVPLKAAGLLVLAVQALRARGVAAEAVIAGEGAERATVARLIADTGMGEHVTLVGLVDDMAAFYRGIDVFISTSMHETLSLVCLEAMAQGVPVIASQVDGFPEVIQHGVTGLCLTPTLSVADYAALTGASTAFAPQVYDPASQQLVDTHLLSPDALADGVLALTRQASVYQAYSTAALAAAHNPVFSPAAFTARLYGALGRYGGGCGAGLSLSNNPFKGCETRVSLRSQPAHQAAGIATGRESIRTTWNTLVKVPQ